MTQQQVYLGLRYEENMSGVCTCLCYQMAGLKSKINNSSRVELELQRNAGPSAIRLQEIMLKVDKIQCMYLVIKCITVRTF